MDSNLKKLLFPAFADAGANDTFGENNNTTSNGETDTFQQGGVNISIMERNVSSNSGDARSEATTALHDNRTSSSLLPSSSSSSSGRKQPQRQPQPLQEEFTTVPLDTSTVPPNSVSDAINATATIGSYAKTRGKPFFPSTAPMPPPRARLTADSRTVSMSANVGIVEEEEEEDEIGEVHDRKEDQSTADVHRDDPAPEVSSALGFDYSSVTDDNNTTSDNTRDASSLMGPDFLSSVGSFQASSEAVSEIRPERGDEHQKINPEEQDDTPIKDNRGSQRDGSQRDGRTQRTSTLTADNLAALKEAEESSLSRINARRRTATTAATDVSSNVSSTASEMGTVVNMGNKMAEVNAMLTPLAASSGSDSSSTFNRVPGLSLPSFEESSFAAAVSPTSAEVAAATINSGAPVLLETAEPKGNGVSPVESAASAGDINASSLVSAAFRRLGSSGSSGAGHSQSSLNRRGAGGAASAPSTPRNGSRSDDAYWGLKSPSGGTGPSFSAISSGARPTLSPRFSASFGGGLPMRRKLLEPRNSTSELKHANSLASPLRFVTRGCLSFDNKDENGVFNASHHYAIEQQKEGERTPLHSPTTSRGGQTQPIIQTSKSWDVSSFYSPRSATGAATHTNSSRGGAFRNLPLFDSTRAFPTENSRKHNNSSAQATSPKDYSPAVLDSKRALALRTPQRIEIEREDALDILSCLVERSAAFEKESPIPSSRNHHHGRSLMPSTIDEIGEETATKEETEEREEVVDNDNVAEDDDKVSTFAEVGGGHSRPNEQDEETSGRMTMSSPPKTRRRRLNETTMETEPFATDSVASRKILKYIDELREMSRRAATKDAGYGQHDERMKAVDELLLSHTYAAEMKRATKSASVWLRSIGRDETETTGNASQDLSKTTSMPVNANEIEHRLSGEAAQTDSASQSAGDDAREISRFIDKMDVLGLKAMVHSSELKAKEKEEQVHQLNEELSRCRAEIGRLKSSRNRNEKVHQAKFLSPNRSVLDNTDDESAESNSVELNRMGDGNHVSLNLSPIRRDGTDITAPLMEASFAASEIDADGEVQAASPANTALIEARREINILRDALKKANGRIAEIGSERKKQQRNGYSSPRAEEDNFVSQWHSLESGLAPPPDHELRSPIVAALLEQWTPEKSMHDSLLAWIDRVMGGAPFETVPPLTLSSLDHQVRDGLVMHVIPLLSKRSDVVVDVQTRTHRQTTYDLSVTIRPNEQSFLHRRAIAADLGSSGSFSDTGVAGSVAHSATTAPISNISKFRAIDSVMANSSLQQQGPRLNISATASSNTDDTSVASNGGMSQKNGLHQQQAQGSLMSSITSFGGLLTRRPKPQTQASFDDESVQERIPSFLRPPPSPQQQQLPQALPEGDEHQPYHRVVSAPPGRIGVTFVQYRGHAMVSDVAVESPLAGWVFPSDILIAIDEVPVSGMRVREIVKLLTTRKDRQRALRVISSHAMNEFTLNSSALGDVVS